MSFFFRIIAKTLSATVDSRNLTIYNYTLSESSRPSHFFVNYRLVSVQITLHIIDKQCYRSTRILSPWETIFMAAKIYRLRSPDALVCIHKKHTPQYRYSKLYRRCALAQYNNGKSNSICTFRAVALNTQISSLQTVGQYRLVSIFHCVWTCFAWNAQRCPRFRDSLTCASSQTPL